MNKSYSYGLLQWETWLMIEFQQEYPSHCLRIILEVNFSQAVPVSGLRKHKAGEAKTWTEWGKATFWFGFLRTRRCTYQMTKHWQSTSTFLLLFRTAVLPWGRAAILSGGEHPSCQCKPKVVHGIVISSKIYLLPQKTLATRAPPWSFLFLTYRILFLTRFFILYLETLFHLLFFKPYLSYYYPSALFV